MYLGFVGSHPLRMAGPLPPHASARPGVYLAGFKCPLNTAKAAKQPHNNNPMLPQLKGSPPLGAIQKPIFSRCLRDAFSGSVSCRFVVLVREDERWPTGVFGAKPPNLRGGSLDKRAPIPDSKLKQQQLVENTDYRTGCSDHRWTTQTEYCEGTRQLRCTMLSCRPLSRPEHCEPIRHL